MMAALKPAARQTPTPTPDASAAARPLVMRPSRHWWFVMFWLAVLAMMSTSIFAFTRTWVFVGTLIHIVAPGGVSESTQFFIHLVIRKLAHFAAYLVFFVALMTGPLRGRPYWALLVCLALAVADETHQLFVPGRTGSPYDVAIDFTGALFGRFLYLGIARR